MKHFFKLLFSFFLSLFLFSSFVFALDFSFAMPARVASGADWFNESAINVNRLKEIWMDRYTTERGVLQRPAYEYDLGLERSAQSWAEIMVQRYGKYPNANSVHKRNLSDTYFDSKKIAAWFGTQGLVVSPGQFVENVGYGYLKCPPTGDCTAKARDAIRTTLTFFMNEKPRNGAHYRSIMSKVYTHVGLGFAWDKANNRYWIVIHYAKFGPEGSGENTEVGNDIMN